jgi:hypothetical protein
LSCSGIGRGDHGGLVLQLADAAVGGFAVVGGRAHLLFGSGWLLLLRWLLRWL